MGKGDVLKSVKKGKNMDIKMEESMEESLNLNDTKGGMEFYLKGGISEVDAVKNRLRTLSSKQISEEDIARLDTLEQPPVPGFRPKTQAQINSMWAITKKWYRKKMASFERRRREWDNSKAGRIWKKTLAEILDAPVEQIYPEDTISLDNLKIADENILKTTEKLKPSKEKKKKDSKKKGEDKKTGKVTQVKKEVDYSKVTDMDLYQLDDNQLDEFIEYKTKEGNYQPIEEDPDAMDAALEMDDTEEFKKKDSLISQAEILKARNAEPQGQFAVEQYISQTSTCNQMNSYYRTGKTTRGPMFVRMAKNAHKMLSVPEDRKNGI